MYPLAGPPRAWETGIQVATYCTANALNHNLFTEIPIVQWSGIGPEMAMAFYHNSASVNSPFDLTAGMGFDLGPGWTTSFSAHTVMQSGNRLVIWDDGRQDSYTPDGASGWTRPRGGRSYEVRVPDSTRGLLPPVTDKCSRRLGSVRAARLSLRVF